MQQLFAQRLALVQLRGGYAVGNRRHARVGRQKRCSETPLRIHLEITQQPRDVTVDRKTGQGRALHEIGLRGSFDHQKAIVGKAARLLPGNHLAQAPVYMAKQFFGQTLVLMKAFPLQAAVCLPGQNGTWDRQGDKEQTQQATQAAFARTHALAA